MNVYSIERPAHKFLHSSEINENLQKDENLEIKIIAKFKKYISKEELQKIFEKFAIKNNFVFPKKNLNEKKFKEELLMSRITLFENKNNFFIVDASNLESNFLVIDKNYFLFGNFDFIENDIPVFFCSSISELGFYDENIVDSVTDILRIKNII